MSAPPTVPILTIDGPSGSGKGTVSRAIADTLQWRLLDSGALYRLVALAGADRGLDPQDTAAHARLAVDMAPVSRDTGRPLPEMIRQSSSQWATRSEITRVRAPLAIASEARPHSSSSASASPSPPRSTS